MASRRDHRRAGKETRSRKRQGKDTRLQRRWRPGPSPPKWIHEQTSSVVPSPARQAEICYCYLKGPSALWFHLFKQETERIRTNGLANIWYLSMVIFSAALSEIGDTTTRHRLSVATRYVYRIIGFLNLDSVEKSAPQTHVPFIHDSAIDPGRAYNPPIGRLGWCPWSSYRGVDRSSWGPHLRRRT